MTIHKLKNITYELHKMEKALVFQVLEQDESWWCKTRFGIDHLSFITKLNKVKVRSGDRVSFFESDYDKRLIIDLKGYKSYKGIEFEFCTRFYRSNNKRGRVYTKINQALKEWDEMVEKKRTRRTDD